MSDTSTREKQLIKEFLDFGTANGFGDLSMLVPWLFKAEASHSHLIEEVQEYFGNILNDGVTGKPMNITVEEISRDVISLLKRKAQ
jgi:hypothetical protein